MPQLRCNLLPAYPAEPCAPGRLARRVDSRRISAAVAACTLLGVLGVASLRAAERPAPDAAGAGSSASHRLPAVHARSVRTDTLFLGGYAQGSFHEALQTLASDLSAGERTLVGRHLDRIFAGVLHGEDLETGGRLRLAYERVARPDGRARSIRVLAAEAAVGGRMHTAFYFEHDDRPGYYDHFGRSLDAGGWLHPLPYATVSSPFNSQRMHPILERVLPHLGVDYVAPEGTPVRASADGSVSIAERRGGYGNLIEIQHPNGYSTRYAHLSRFASAVYAGAYVRQGDVIGYVGATGLATGPHLHYEIRRRGRPLDPQVAAADAVLSDELPFSPGWSSERQQLAQLLARAPRSLSRRP